MQDGSPLNNALGKFDVKYDVDGDVSESAGFMPIPDPGYKGEGEMTYDDNVSLKPSDDVQVCIYVCVCVN